MPNTTSPPITKATQQALAGLGTTGMGNLQDAALKTQILTQDEMEEACWRKRKLALLKSKYEAQLTYLTQDVTQQGQMQSTVPKNLQETPENKQYCQISSIASDLSVRQPRLDEMQRVVTYKTKVMALELNNDTVLVGELQALDTRLQSVITATQSYGAINSHPYTQSDPRTYLQYVDKEACGWVHIPRKISVGGNRTVAVYFQGGADNLVQAQFAQWFESLVKALAAKVPLQSLEISSTSEGRHARFSWHYKGAAVDITQLNRIHCAPAGTLRAVGGETLWLELQQTAATLGAHEDKGPYIGTDAYHLNHVHLSIASEPRAACTTSNKGGVSPQNIPSGQDQ